MCSLTFGSFWWIRVVRARNGKWGMMCGKMNGKRKFLGEKPVWDWADLWKFREWKRLNNNSRMDWIDCYQLITKFWNWVDYRNWREILCKSLEVDFDEEKYYIYIHRSDCYQLISDFFHPKMIFLETCFFLMFKIHISKTNLGKIDKCVISNW